MKTAIKILILLLVVSMLVGVDGPPPLPSSFYGYVNAAAGSTVRASVGGVVQASAKVRTWDGKTVYSLDVGGWQVEGAPPITEGALITFRVNGLYVGQAYWHSGTNVRLDLAVKSFWSFRR